MVRSICLLNCYSLAHPISIAYLRDVSDASYTVYMLLRTCTQ